MGVLASCMRYWKTLFSNVACFLHHIDGRRACNSSSLLSASEHSSFSPLSHFPVRNVFFFLVSTLLGSETCSLLRNAAWDSETLQWKLRDWNNVSLLDLICQESNAFPCSAWIVGSPCNHQAVELCGIRVRKRLLHVLRTLLFECLVYFYNCCTTACWMNLKFLSFNPTTTVHYKYLHYYQELLNIRWRALSQVQVRKYSAHWETLLSNSPGLGCP